MFTFKKFQLSDQDCAMKIGTDGVLLGAYASTIKARHVLDAGTGCGIISLMIAQKNKGNIHAIDIDKKAVERAACNFRQSPWSDRLKVFHSRLQDFSPSPYVPYDLVVCNPPFFRQSLKSLHTARSMARHDLTLSFHDLFVHTVRLLNPHGKLVMIHPKDTAGKVWKEAEETGLYILQKLIIQPSPTHKPTRVISTLSMQKCMSPQTNTLCIETGKRHQFSDAYKELTRDYHPFL